MLAAAAAFQDHQAHLQAMALVPPSAIEPVFDQSANPEPPANKARRPPRAEATVRPRSDSGGQRPTRPRRNSVKSALRAEPPSAAGGPVREAAITGSHAAMAAAASSEHTSAQARSLGNGVRDGANGNGRGPEASPRSPLRKAIAVPATGRVLFECTADVVDEQV